MDKEITNRIYRERAEDLKKMPKEIVQELAAKVKEPWTKIFLTEPDIKKWPAEMYRILKPYLGKN